VLSQYLISHPGDTVLLMRTPADLTSVNRPSQKQTSYGIRLWSWLLGDYYW
jgi:hypothetical protein